MSEHQFTVEMARKIELWPVAKLKPYERNARTHSPEQVAKIAASMTEFGFTNPILVDSQSGIIAGHGRLEAAKRLRLEQVPVIVLDHLSEAQRRAYILADNRLALDAGWDDAILGEELRWLGENDFDLELTGFNEDELSELMPEVQKLEPQADEDSIPEAVEPRTKRGDIYKLGRHRLMCGDSTMVDEVERLMNGEKADALFTDPPYNIDFKPQRGTHDRILNDDMDAVSFANWLAEVFGCAKVVTLPNTFAFVWSGWSTIDQFAPVLRRFYDLKAIHIWVKNNFGIGYYSRPKYEPFFLCLNGNPQVPSVAPADVWEHARVHKTEHSCEKPVGLIEKILGAYEIGKSVLDFFGGSGSTLIACEKTNRRCFIMELDPKYCDVIVARWEKYTGQKAELVTQA